MKRKQHLKEYQLPIGFKMIRKFRKDEKPHERVFRHGAQTLSDAELIALLISKGTKVVSTVDISRMLLNKYGSISDLCSRDVSELCSIKGIGLVRAIKLIAAFELTRRIESAPFDSRRVVRSAQDIAAYYIPRLRGALRESFRVLLLNSANQVFREAVVSEGSLNASIVHPREVFRTAITEAAASVILLHNHPSGNVEPSREDIAITRQLVDAGAIIDIKVLDHLIIAGESFTSLSERGLM